jgi:hypothetical protein
MHKGNTNKGCNWKRKKYYTMHVRPETKEKFLEMMKIHGSKTQDALMALALEALVKSGYSYKPVTRKHEDVTKQVVESQDIEHQSNV